MTAETTSRTNAPSQSQAAATRGFTLTEIAIVLGIIGVILGAIWVAASAVYTNMRVSAGNRELLQIVQAVRALYATSSTVDAAANMDTPAKGTDLAGKALTYVRAGVFPADALNTGVPSTATQTTNPWGGFIDINAATVSATDDSFTVTFDEIPPGACINMLTASSGQGRDPGMYNACGGSPNAICATTNTLPLGAATAQGECEPGSGATTASASFFFNLRATN